MLNIEPHKSGRPVAGSPVPPGAPGAASALQPWQRVRARLQAEFGQDVFSSWFGGLELAAIKDGVAQLTVPTRFLRGWLQSHYLERLQAIACEELPDAKLIEIGVRTSLMRARSGPSGAGEPCAQVKPAAAAKLDIGKPAHSADSRAQAGASDGAGLAGSPLDRRMTFESFIAGRGNALAHAAAQQIGSAGKGEGPAYNPLFIHASVGLGKTHLLQAISQAAEASGRRVHYLTAERFMYGFVAALKAQTAIAFKETLRAIDVLIVDDIQFLQGKTIQQEFCHTLNALLDAGKQVVVAADSPPVELENLDDRARSRLGGGLVVEIGPHDEALRLKILGSRIAAAKAHLPSFEVEPQVVLHLARTIDTNGRDLEGVVNRLVATASLSGGSFDMASALAAIRDLVRPREPKRVKIEDILRLVANHFNVSRSDILSARRTATVVRPRQIAMYLAKVLTLRSLPEIGRRFGGRDHTTVLHAVRKIEDLKKRDQALHGDLEHLKRMLQE